MEEWLLARAKVGEKFQYRVTSEEREHQARPSSAASVDRRAYRHRRRAASECRKLMTFVFLFSSLAVNYHLLQIPRVAPPFPGPDAEVLVLTGPRKLGGRSWWSVRTVECLLGLVLQAPGARGGLAIDCRVQ